MTNAVKIDNAGTSELNGIYKDTGETQNGKPIYKNLSNGNYIIYYDSDFSIWYIWHGEIGNGENYYSSADSNLKNGMSWIPGFGDNPPPSTFLIVFDDTTGQAEISKNYPVPSSTGVGATDYHKGREINLVPKMGSLVPRRTKQGL